MGADTYGVFQHSLRYHLMALPLLGRDDNLPRHDIAHGSVVDGHMAENPSKSGHEVAIAKLHAKHFALLAVFTAAVTLVFCFILKALNTPNLVISTVSVTTSFLAASLTMLRSSYYALGYAANDLVLIVMWVLASMQDTAYIPVAVNFAIFFLNDMYGFICWKQRERQG